MNHSNTGAHPRGPNSAVLAGALAQIEQRMIFQLQRLAVRHGNELAGFSGLVIRDEEVVALLDELRGESTQAVQAPPPLSLTRRTAPRDLSDPTDEDDLSGRMPTGEADPLLRLAVTFGLSEFELLAVVVALAVELDGRYARLIAYLNDNATKTRPSVALTMQLLRPLEIANPDAVACFLPEAPLRRHALVELEGEGPLMDLTLRIPDSAWPRITGLAHAPCAALARPPGDAGETLEELILPDGIRAKSRHVAEVLQRAPRATVAVTGPPGSGRDALARAIAWATGRPALCDSLTSGGTAEELRSTLRDARWENAVAVFAVADDAPEPATPLLAAITEHPDIIIWTGQRLPGWTHTARPGRIELPSQRPDTTARQALLKRFLHGSGYRDRDIAQVAAHYRLGPTKLSQAAALACAPQEKDGPSRDKHQLERACQAICDADFGSMAERLPCAVSREDLVVPERVWVELEYVLAWYRHHHALAGNRDGRPIASANGLACLLSGGPGTGKTLAAQVIAAELGLPLYRIDLSQVVNKYIGETEKNLARVFDAAHEAHAVLFFDEADALFGKRTKTRDAHDRYANIETGYLLQRLEAHEGISILATNLPGNLDEAFTRRFQVTADFPLPSPSDRARIWDHLLPPTSERAADLDVATLGQSFEFSGGEIKNAALAAALFATRDGTALALEHAQMAARRELSKAGRLVG